MEGMRQVVTSGTARRAEVPGFDVCGKTGTAQVVSIRTGATGKQKEHAWFVGFAPKPEEGRLPEIAVVVLVEHGGHGGTISAPIAQAIIAEYVRKTRGGVEGAAANGAAPLMNFRRSIREEGIARELFPEQSLSCLHRASPGAPASLSAGSVCFPIRRQDAVAPGGSSFQSMFLTRIINSPFRLSK